MKAPSITNLDLNLLKVFDAIFAERNIVRAARRLGLSQPAASHALARLRHALKDELFVRSSQGMVPTVRAEQLAGPVRQALNYLELGLQSGSFDPETTHQNFRLAVDNCTAIAFIDRLVNTIARAAPKVSLDIRPSGTIDVDRLIDTADLDVFIGRPLEKRERFGSEELASGDFVVMHRVGLRLAEGPMTAMELCERPHLALSSTGDDTSFVDTWLAEQELSRKTCYSVPLLGCASILATQDVFVVIRRSIAVALCHSPVLKIAELPFQSPSVATCMRWHRRHDTQPSHTWLRSTIAAAFEPEARGALYQPL